MKKIAVPITAAIVAGLIMVGMAAADNAAHRDGVVIAKSYAEYNDQQISEDSETCYSSVEIPERNTFQEVTAKEARNIKNGIVVFAFPKCPYCRNLIPVLADVANKENQKIYYCKIDDYRDKYKFNPETKEIERTVEPGEGYDELLNWLDEYLNDYILKDEEENPVETGEKRIGAPTIFRIENGEPVSIWKLNDVDVEYPESGHTPWDETIIEKVSESLLNFFEV